ncbi:MAG: hypothetical protein F4Y02_03355, partial [Chloroflexi bacterium]|nr:hypothetical protein [Chloroflexota bacterium]
MSRFVLAITTGSALTLAAAAAHAGAIEGCTQEADAAVAAAAQAAIADHPGSKPEPHDHSESHAAAYAALASVELEDIDVRAPVEGAWQQVGAPAPRETSMVYTKPRP